MRALCARAGALSALLALSCAAPPAPPPVPALALPEWPVLTRIIFTTAIDEHNKPANDVRSTGVSEEQFYIFISWMGLELSAHQFRVEFYDGAGELVFVGQLESLVSEPSWDTWFGYRPNAATDALGTWRFKGYLDGELAFESSLEVGLVPQEQLDPGPPEDGEASGAGEGAR